MLVHVCYFVKCVGLAVAGDVTSSLVQVLAKSYFIERVSAFGQSVDYRKFPT